MEYNEVFSVSRSAMFGEHRRKPDAESGSKNGGIADAYMWSSSPVDSLRAAAVAGGKRNQKRRLKDSTGGRQNVDATFTSSRRSSDGDISPSAVTILPETGTPAVLEVTEERISVGSRHRIRSPVDGEEVSVGSANDGVAAANGNKNDDKPEPGYGNLSSESRARRWLQLCHCRRELLAIKVFYFAFIGSLGVVFTYASVFLKQHGLSAFEIGVISGIRPVIGFLSAPLWGVLADRYNIRRFLMLFSLIAWLAFFVGLYTVREPERRVECPDSLQPFVQRSKAHVVERRDSAEYDSNSSSKVLKTDRGSGAVFNSSSTNGAAMFSASTKYSLTTESQVEVSFTSALTNVTRSVGELNSSFVSDKDQELLREDLDWLYEPTSRYHVFIICLAIICGGELFQAPTTAMSDAATLQILGRERLHEYGAQRAWGPVGWAISSFFTGSILDSLHWNEVKCGVSLSFTDYRVVSYIFIPTFVLGLVAALKINFGTHIPNNKKINEKTDLGESDSSNARSESPPSTTPHNTFAVVKVFLNVRNGSWILTTFFVGACNGVIWGFLFWHLDNLGGSKMLMGVDGIVVCVFEFVSFFAVDYVIKIIGHMGVMYVGLLGYAIRFTVYASITNPWTVLPVETLQGVTFSFIWVSLSQYTAVAVPSASLGTIQGIIHGVYFGLGNGVGHFLGGVLIGQFGAVATFYGFAVSSVVWLITFFVCQKFSKKPTDPFAYQDMNADDDGTSVTGSDSRH